MRVPATAPATLSPPGPVLPLPHPQHTHAHTHASSGTRHTAQSGTTHYYFYNITNALAMVESGATPELTEIHVALDWVSKLFDITYVGRTLAHTSAH